MSAKARNTYGQQKKKAAIRAKYGPRRRPAPVLVKKLDGETGEWVELGLVDQARFIKKQYAETLERKAVEAGYGSYQEYLRSEWWMALRDRVMERDHFRCRHCKSRKKLAVHHRYYARLGAETLRSLETLCDRCHRKAHS